MLLPWVWLWVVVLCMTIELTKVLRCCTPLVAGVLQTCYVPPVLWCCFEHQSGSCRRLHTSLRQLAAWPCLRVRTLLSSRRMARKPGAVTWVGVTCGLVRDETRGVQVVLHWWCGFGIPILGGVGVVRYQNCCCQAPVCVVRTPVCVALWAPPLSL